MNEARYIVRLAKPSDNVPSATGVPGNVSVVGSIQAPPSPPQLAVSMSLISMPRMAVASAVEPPSGEMKSLVGVMKVRGKDHVCRPTSNKCRVCKERGIGGNGLCDDHMKSKYRCVECFDMGRTYVTQICQHRRQRVKCKECRANGYTPITQWGVRKRKSKGAQAVASAPDVVKE